MAALNRTWIVTIVFGVIFAAIANLAWNTGISTTGPWFAPGVTLQVYSITLIGALLLAFGLAAVAANRVGHYDSLLRSFDMRISAVKALVATRARESGKDAVEPRTVDQEINEVLGDLESLASDSVRSETGHADSLVQLDEILRLSDSRTQTVVLRELVRERIGLRAAQSRLLSTAAGPAVTALIFVGISAMMLPGSIGFAETNFRLTTGLILFLAYGWAFLAAWAFIAVIMTSTDRARSSS